MERNDTGKWQRREGMKRNLRDLTPVSYMEYDTSWEDVNQSKKCRKEINCQLVDCECRRGI